MTLGDFNIRWDCQKNADTKQLADILRSANLRQHFQERTHRHGHILHLNAITSAKYEYYNKKIIAFNGNQRTVFSVMNTYSIT